MVLIAPWEDTSMKKAREYRAIIKYLYKTRGPTTLVGHSLFMAFLFLILSCVCILVLSKVLLKFYIGMLCAKLNFAFDFLGRVVNIGLEKVVVRL